VQAGGWDWQDRTGRPPGIRDKGDRMDKVKLKLSVEEASIVRLILLKRVDEMELDPRFADGTGGFHIRTAERVANKLRERIERAKRLAALLFEED
jgi:hypothetical protein